MNRREFLKMMIGTGIIVSVSNNSYAGAWEIKNEWNLSEFDKYSKWVNSLYKSRKGTIDKLFSGDRNILNDVSFNKNGNPQIDSNILSSFRALTHCGDFPELLMIYYAYRRGLPWRVAEIKMESGGDIRYSSGNHPVGEINSIYFNGDLRSFLNSSLQGQGFNFVSGNFRTSPKLEKTDSVPIRIDRECLKPGSIVYNANGHVLVVGEIDESGEVHFLDAHPDTSITFNQTLSAIPFVKSAEFGINGLKKCYDGFRNLRLVHNSGEVFSNEEMIDYGFSLEQYQLMAKLKENGYLIINGERVNDFPGIVRAKLRRGVESPLEFLIKSSDEIHQMFQERKRFVDNAWKDVLNNGPITFPNDSTTENIYEATGRWETWSSPSSDVDRKSKLVYVAKRISDMINNFGSAGIYDYSQFSSREDMIKKMFEMQQKLFDEKKIDYETSRGKSFSLSLKDIEKRLFDMSFDPNHPPELRWGAPENSSERENMVLFPTPLRTGGKLNALEAYEKERGIRFYLIRQTNPTSLEPSNNPNKSDAELPSDVLKKFLQTN